MAIDYQREIEDPSTQERAVRITPVTPYYSYLMIAVLIGVFGAQVAVDSFDSIVLGGMRAPLIAGFYKEAFAGGDYWRMLTGATLHGGIIHLFFNCYALYVLGKLIELLSNRAHLPIIFILSAIGGNLLTYAVNPVGISIGASGGIIGFLGYLTVYGFFRRKVMSNSLFKNMLFNVVFIGFVGVYVIDKVDNFAHLGGLIVGAAYGFFQVPRDLYADPRIASEPAKIAGFAALGIFLFTAVVTVLLLFQIISF
ncbi:MAG: rhomboid family intramembrane serine protease [Pyrinomonadaceae bacterium]|nr:rhomboid family intramembrane serine protease [Pyrinomonadaceae bacterium]